MNSNKHSQRNPSREKHTQKKSRVREKTAIAWFSHLLQHLARKQIVLIL